jgi:membrane protein
LQGSLKNILINKLQEGLRFIHFVIVHFINDDCTYRASALAFTSLLAVIPLMTVGLAVLTAFPVFENLADPVQNFIFDNFVPETGKVVQSYLHQFTVQVANLSTLGIAILVLTALLLMVTIERAMNKIWRAPSSRQGVAAFLLYWAILSLGPVLLGLSLAASSYVFSLPFIHNAAPSFLIKATPFFLSLTAFTLLYVVVPNCPVKITHGLWGGIIAALLFESAKQGFVYYLTHYNSYKLVYGAFATIPVFFIWIYWMWIITLLGAEISYAFSVHHKRRVGKPLDGFSHALLWLYSLWQVQQEGKSLSLDALIGSTNHPFAVDTNEMISTLSQLGLIHRTHKGYFMLSRDLHALSLYDLSQQLPYPLPTQRDLDNEDESPLANWRTVFRQNDAELQKNLSMKLYQLFHST